MIIVCNGGYRTGSTLVHSIVLELYCVAGIETNNGLLDYTKIQDLDDNEIHVIKSHNWIPPKYSKVKTIYTRRNYLDVYSSFVKIEEYKKRNINVVENITNERVRRTEMLTRPSLTLDYEDFFNNEEWLIDKISSYIEMPISNFNKKLLAERLSYKTIKQETDLNKSSDSIWPIHHVSDDPSPGNYINILDYDIIKKIVKAHRR